MEFARKTGDLRSLSVTDVRVTALVYTLEKELVGTDHIRTEPTNKVLVHSLTAATISVLKNSTAVDCKLLTDIEG